MKKNTSMIDESLPAKRRSKRKSTYENQAKYKNRKYWFITIQITHNSININIDLINRLENVKTIVS